MKGKNCHFFDARSRKGMRQKQNTMNKKKEITIKINSSGNASPNASETEDEFGDQTIS